MFIEKLIDYLETKVQAKRLALFKTLYINFRCLPIKQAIKFPIKLYGKIRIKSLSGVIRIDDKSSLKIGVDVVGYRTRETSTINIMQGGKLIIKGMVLCYQGSSLLVGPKALLVLNNYVTLGDNAEIICKKKIVVGEHTGITWDCQVTDFGSHPIMNLNAGVVGDLYKSVIIGNYCWIGNRTTIMPGTVLPDRTIVASNSLLNKDYITNGIKPYSMIGGIPAKMIREGVKRVDY